MKTFDVVYAALVPVSVPCGNPYKPGVGTVRCRTDAVEYTG